MVATGFIVENVVIGLLALVALGLTIYQGFIDVTTEKAQHKLLKATHGCNFFAALSFVLVQFDPKALYGVLTQGAVNFLKTTVVMFLFMGAQTLLVTYLYALTKANLGKRPIYLIRVLQVSSTTYAVVLLSLMITEASLHKRFFEGVPLLCEAVYCMYLVAFALYSTTDLRRALLAHIATKMGAVSSQLQGALKRVRHIQILMVCTCSAATIYMFYFGISLVQLDPSLVTQPVNPDEYLASTPFANILTACCIYGMLYAAYSSKQSMSKFKRTPSASSLEKSPSKAALDKVSTMTLQSDKSSSVHIDVGNNSAHDAQPVSSTLSSTSESESL